MRESSAQALFFGHSSDEVCQEVSAIAEQPHQKYLTARSSLSRTCKTVVSTERTQRDSMGISSILALHSTDPISSQRVCAEPSSPQKELHPSSIEGMGVGGKGFRSADSLLRWLWDQRTFEKRVRLIN